MFLPAQRVYSSNSVGVIDQVPGSFSFHHTSSRFLFNHPRTVIPTGAGRRFFPSFVCERVGPAQRRNLSSISRASQALSRRDENTFTFLAQTYFTVGSSDR